MKIGKNDGKKGGKEFSKKEWLTISHDEGNSNSIKNKMVLYQYQNI